MTELKVGDQVSHRKYGAGVVVQLAFSSRTGWTAVVQFEESGIVTVSVLALSA
jgi:hypothetical protein